MIELGSRVRDKVSGLEGIVIAHTEHITGCATYTVQPPVKDGKRPELDAFDESRLEVLMTPAQTGVHKYNQSLNHPSGGPVERVREDRIL